MAVDSELLLDSVDSAVSSVPAGSIALSDSILSTSVELLSLSLSVPVSVSVESVILSVPVGTVLSSVPVESVTFSLLVLFFTKVFPLLQSPLSHPQASMLQPGLQYPSPI